MKSLRGRKIIRIFVVAVVILAMLIGGTACTKDNVPDDAKEIYEAYCSYRMVGEMEEALRYVYFPPEYDDYYQEMMDNNTLWLEYEILDWSVAESNIYDECYMVKFNVEVPLEGEDTYNNYVCLVDGEWRVVLNEMYI